VPATATQAEPSAPADTLARADPNGHAAPIRREADAPAPRAAGSEAPQAFPSPQSKAAANGTRRSEERLGKQDAHATDAGPRETGSALTSAAPSAAPSPAPAPAPGRPAALADAPAPASPPAQVDTAPTGERPRVAQEGESQRDPAANAFPAAAQRAASARLPASPDSSAPLAVLREALLVDGARWSRRVHSGGSAPVDDATRRWLADLEAATRGRWIGAARRRRGRRRRCGAASGATASLTLLLDGRPAAVIAIAAAAASYESPLDGPLRRWQAPIGAADAARLAATLPH
jgi:hypothetical protein